MESPFISLGQCGGKEQKNKAERTCFEILALLCTNRFTLVKSVSFSRFSFPHM